jgi:hypothetical protein
MRVAASKRKSWMDVLESEKAHIRQSELWRGPEAAVTTNESASEIQAARLGDLRGGVRCRRS